MVTFNDLTKANDDLLFKGFPHEKPWNLEIKHKLSQPLFTHNASLSPTGLLSASASSKFAPLPEVDITTTASLDGTAVITASYCPKWAGAGVLTLSNKFNRNLWKNVTSTAESCVDLKKGPIHTRTSYNVMNNVFSHSLLFNYEGKNANIFKGNAMMGYDLSLTNWDVNNSKISIGAGIIKEVEDYRLLAALKVVPYGSKPFGKVSAILNSKAIKASSKAELGVEVSEIIPDKKTIVSLGGLWYLDKAAKDTYIKGKIDHDGNLAACVGHKLHQDMSIVIGAMTDIKKSFKPSEPNVKFGLTLKLQT